MITVNDISVQFGGTTLFSDVSFAINENDKIALMGKNGAGKSTLLKIIAGQSKPSTGNISAPKDAVVAYLPQHLLTTDGATVMEETSKAFGEIFSMKAEIDEINEQLTVRTDYESDAYMKLIERVSDLSEKFYAIEEVNYEAEVEKILIGLGLWNYKHLKWSELSSGYKMRFELARTLLRKPELLLLDEPLANLDVLAQQVILEDLKAIANSVNHPIALILSSQQLYEVEKVSDKVIFLKNGQYKNNENGLISDNQLIIEIDTSNSREDLLETFKNFKLEKLNFNGGVFVAYFAEETELYQVILALGNAKIQITYLRNISNSTRRFFVH